MRTSSHRRHRHPQGNKPVTSTQITLVNSIGLVLNNVRWKKSTLTLSSPEPSNKAQSILEGSFRVISSILTGSLESTTSHTQHEKIEGEDLESLNNPNST